MQTGWFYDFSNYGTYKRLTQDGITQCIQHFCCWARRWSFAQQRIEIFVSGIGQRLSQSGKIDGAVNY